MDNFTRALRNTQVITCALAGGLLVLMAVAVFLVVNVKPGGFLGDKGPTLGGLPIVSLVLVGNGVLILVLSLVVPPLILQVLLKSWAKSTEPMKGELTAWETSDIDWLQKVPTASLQQLLGIFQSKKIVTAALAEGAGFCGAMAYLLESQWYAVVLLLLAIATMLGRLATRASLNQWLYDRVMKLEGAVASSK